MPNITQLARFAGHVLNRAFGYDNFEETPLDYDGDYIQQCTMNAECQNDCCDQSSLVCVYRPARIDCIGSMTSTELFSTLILSCLLSVGAMLLCGWYVQRCYRSWQTSQVKKRMDAYETAQTAKI